MFVMFKVKIEARNYISKQPQESSFQNVTMSPL